MIDYYTVSQYAKIVNKDTSSIRKMLIEGQIKGEKLGRQWIIPKDTIYPTDRRVKSGEYRNWRNSVKLNKNHKQLMKQLKVMCNELSNLYGSKLDSVVLYGSYARGEETDESDVDIAMILNTDSTEEQHDKMLDVVVNHELQLDVVLSVVPIDLKQYNEWNKVLPFYKNIEKEGICLWKRI